VIRLARFFGITPLLATLRSTPSAARIAVVAAAPSPDASAVRASLTTDFTRVRDVLFLAARFKSWRARFLADLWFANSGVLRCGGRRIGVGTICVDGHLGPPPTATSE
jgi:hypothetical protein